MMQERSLLVSLTTGSSHLWVYCVGVSRPENTPGTIESNRDQKPDYGCEHAPVYRCASRISNYELMTTFSNSFNCETQRLEEQGTTDVMKNHLIAGTQRPMSPKSRYVQCSLISTKQLCHLHRHRSMSRTDSVQSDSKMS